MDTLVNPTLGKVRQEQLHAFKDILNYIMNSRQVSICYKSMNILSQKQKYIAKYYPIYMKFLKEKPIGSFLDLSISKINESLNIETLRSKVG